MALFGLIKKEKKKKIEEEVKEKIILNHKEYPRYIVHNLETNLGKAIDISINSISIAIKNSHLEIGESVELVVEKERYLAEVVRKTTSKVVFIIDNKFPVELIKRHMIFLQECDIEPKKKFEGYLLENEEDFDKNRAIVNLMIEIDDPNTNIQKISDNIEFLPKLKEQILLYANNIENSRTGRVDTIEGAVARLGFDTIKKGIYDYITLEINFSHEQLSDFKDFEFMNLFGGAFFKKVAPLFAFNDLRSEGRSLLNVAYIGAILLSKLNSKIKKYYTDIGRLYSYEMRLLEFKESGIDFLEINKLYFVKDTGVFQYLYDGFILANVMLYPHYSLKNPVLLSQRKMRYAYVVYLTLLALKSVIFHDKKSATILSNRMKRLGFEDGELYELFSNIAENINKQFSLIGISKKMVVKKLPYIPSSLSSIFGTGIYLEYIQRVLEDFDKKTKRMALRYEDETYTHMALEVILNYDQLELSKEPFCILESDKLEDDELPLDEFSLFDVLVFKNIDRLPKILRKDFEKLWRDFEGKIIVTFCSYRMLEVYDVELYKLLKESLVDFTSYSQSKLVEMKMITKVTTNINEFLRAKECAIEIFKDRLMSASCVYKECSEVI